MRGFFPLVHIPLGVGWDHSSALVFSLPHHGNVSAVQFAGSVFSPDACSCLETIVGNGKFSLMEIWFGFFVVAEMK